jgi:isoquinoline 1-oxidoreductase
MSEPAFDPTAPGAESAGQDREFPAGLEMCRRELFRMFGAGLAVLVLAPAEAQESGFGRRSRSAGPANIDAWIHIGPSGVTAYTGKAEVGQNIRTSLSQAVAEELRVPIGAMTLVMGDTALTPFDMGTFGSMTTPRMAPQLRRAAAAARQAIVAEAARQWGVDPATLSAADGRIVDSAHGRSASYAELLHGRQLTETIDPEIALTPASEWKVEGKALPKVDGRAFVTGGHRYASDIVLPGMVYGKVLRPPSFGATLKSVDFTAANKLPGVVCVREGDLVGCVAPSSARAAAAIGAIRAEWSGPAHVSESEFFDRMRANLPAPSAPPASAIETVYSIAFIAHAPLETRTAVAKWEGDHLTVWTGSQRPFGVRDELARALKMPAEAVRVIVPDTGSGYGGKHTGEYAIEAALLAKGCGRPVKLHWTREEEFTWAYFRPAGIIRAIGAVDADGKLTHWEFDNVNSGPSGIRSPYDVPDQHARFHEMEAPVRQGSYRALAATANHFARESHMDDLARAAHKDPLDFRLINLKDERLRAVLEAAADRFGWSERRRAPHRGFGLACGSEKGGQLANCAEVSVNPETGHVQVLRVVCAFECGAIVNPGHLRNVVEGAMMMGLGGALFEAIHFDEGKIRNPHFSQYRVPRFRDLPKIDVVLLNRPDHPSAGAGETPIVCIAPAIRNAILDATGRRLRTMPLAPHGLKA